MIRSLQVRGGSVLAFVLFSLWIHTPIYAQAATKKAVAKADPVIISSIIPSLPTVDSDYVSYTVELHNTSKTKKSSAIRLQFTLAPEQQWVSADLACINRRGLFNGSSYTCAMSALQPDEKRQVTFRFKNAGPMCITTPKPINALWVSAGNAPAKMITVNINCPVPKKQRPEGCMLTLDQAKTAIAQGKVEVSHTTQEYHVKNDTDCSFPLTTYWSVQNGSSYDVYKNDKLSIEYKFASPHAITTFGVGSVCGPPEQSWGVTMWYGRSDDVKYRTSANALYNDRKPLDDCGMSQ